MGLKMPLKESPILAELIGILLGDGSIGIYKCKRKCGNFSLQHKMQITLNSIDDKDYIIFLEKMIFRLFGVKPKITYRSGRTCDLRLFKKEIIQFLINEIGMVMSPKWKNAKIPDYYLHTDLEIKIIRGYFDTDGSVVVTNNNGTLYPRLEMKICPSPMQSHIIDILKRMEFRFGVYSIGKGKVRIQLNGKQQLEKWIKEIGFSNNKHIIKAKLFFSSKPIAGDGFEPSTFGSPFEPEVQYEPFAS
ncbi:MAG: hypothetical protein JXC85_03720 [Candidatus Aenigmarchaeota archaeon]|nr:hypothetical protein [Candidatus Aenigmarchaeota archaeon]